MIAAACLAAFTGCSDDATAPAAVEPGTGTAVNLKGTLANATLSGDIDTTIAATASNGVAPITGCVYLKTATCVTTTGGYTVSTHTLNFGTTSPSIAFSGTYNNGVVNGQFTNSGGPGFFTTRTGRVSVFCGTFTVDADGTWNFTVQGSALDGIYNDGGSNNRIAGTVSGNNVSITFSGGTATGTLSGSNANGTWVAGSDNGTWTGSNSGCRT